MLAEYALLTGRPELPPLWSLGYQQSHRTLASREEVLTVAKTFREKKLPCDGVIYLGTGFAPSGWNTVNGSFAFNRNVFPDPEQMIRELHALDLRAVLHAVILARSLRGSVRDRSTSRGASGTTSGPRSRSKVAERSAGPSTSRRCRSTCAPAPSCRSGPSSSTPARRPTSR